MKQIYYFFIYCSNKRQNKVFILLEKYLKKYTKKDMFYTGRMFLFHFIFQLKKLLYFNTDEISLCHSLCKANTKKMKKNDSSL